MWVTVGAVVLGLVIVVALVTLRDRRDFAAFQRRFQEWRCPKCGAPYKYEDLGAAVRDADLGREYNDWVSRITCGGCGHARYIDKYGVDAPERYRA